MKDIINISIPKVIHYCWMSDDEPPQLIKDCISSWKVKLPDYEIKRWSYANFPRGKSKWVDQAFDAKKYAFAADFIRAYSLYNEGGIYLDSDVEVVKSFNSLLQYPYFLGHERDGIIEAAVMGAKPNLDLFRVVLEYYDNRDFIKSNGEYDVLPMPKILGEIISRNFEVVEIDNMAEFQDSVSAINILPWTYFSPKSYVNGEMTLCAQTYTIHHFTASWHGKKEKLYSFVSNLLGNDIAKKISKIYKKFFRK